MGEKIRGGGIEMGREMTIRQGGVGIQHKRKSKCHKVKCRNRLTY